MNLANFSVNVLLIMTNIILGIMMFSTADAENYHKYWIGSFNFAGAVALFGTMILIYRVNKKNKKRLDDIWDSVVKKYSE